MTSLYAWSGTLLDIDLTSARVEKRPTPPEFARKYVGGIGFNAVRLFDMTRRGIDALSPENVILFGTGPLTGTLYPGGARLTVTAKSPLTDVFGSTNIGGHFAAELKLAGYDQLAISGKADRPVYLWIDDDKVELRDASHLWGTLTWDTGLKIKGELGDPEIQVLCIGPAGENLVRYASIINPPRGAGGRAGMGAVMGAKNLKAIAVRGTKSVRVARPQEFYEICRASTLVGRDEPRYQALRGGGSPMWINYMASGGTAGVRNYTRQLFPSWTNIAGEKFRAGGEYSVRKRACFSCPIGCSGFFNVRSGEFGQAFGRVPEAGMTLVGLFCDIASVPPLLKMQELFDGYGIDSLSGGQMFSWAMDCYQKGILSREEADGFSLDWGNYNAIVELVPRIANREGFLGNLLAEGEKRAPQILGKSSERLMYHIKGLCPPAGDPRTRKFFGLAYHTAPRGADHLTANVVWIPPLLKGTDLGKKLSADYEKWVATPSPQRAWSIAGIGQALKLCEDISAIINATEICTRTGGSFELLGRALSAATGIDFTVPELIVTGERLFNVEKAFNAREGLTRQDDSFSVPEKFTQEPVAEGHYQGDVLFDLDRMLDDYYQARGWDTQTGLQTKTKLRELGLQDMIPALEQAKAVR